jgi:exonuclease III
MDRDPHCNVVNWNIRGLNNPTRRQVLKELVAQNSCSLVCIQETKLQQVDNMLISSILGQKFLGQYAVLPAEGTWGGIILACS